MIELTSRTSGASEIPSSTSRSSASSCSASNSASSSAIAARAPLVDNCPRERALPGPAADDVQLVFGKQVRRSEQVGDQLGDGVDRRGGQKPPGRGGLAAGLTGGTEIRGTFDVHIPLMRYRPKQPKA